ncbi:hypothetical protein THAOC_25372, partial [Thalassiosira oceanica]
MGDASELSYLATAANDVFNCRYGVADTMRIRTHDDSPLHSHVEVYADQNNFPLDGPYVVNGPLGTGHRRIVLQSVAVLQDRQYRADILIAVKSVGIPLAFVCTAPRGAGGRRLTRAGRSGLFLASVSKFHSDDGLNSGVMHVSPDKRTQKMLGDG